MGKEIPYTPVMFLSDTIGAQDFVLPVNIIAGAGTGGTSVVDNSTFTAGATAGTPAMAENGGHNLILSCDASRNLNVNIAAGTITVSPVVSSTCSTNALNNIGTTSTQVLASNVNRKRAILQNQATLVAYVLLGSGTASLTNYTFAMPACGTAKDGSGPPIFDVMWQGAIQVIYASAGGVFNAQENT